ncbi:hypothetical protein TNIN_66431 [Trichonephila inaurata madagascariensis]|uniref:Uncharacterized protein n=1 Tax=Trichonephila inaurata madagascariensis TaxID=2747483 RepID=A0A8X6IWJ4_9ARAC|nr:hypothetical protein TNIN_66431 [Trichonephila inaurata madagascariensis]
MQSELKELTAHPIEDLIPQEVYHAIAPILESKWLKEHSRGITLHPWSSKSSDFKVIGHIWDDRKDDPI